MDNFKQASRLGLRFTTSKGVLSTEQLWQLSQTDLANCIRNVKKSLKKNDDDDLAFLDSKPTIDSTEQLAFDILKDVYTTKKSEVEAERTKEETKKHNDKINALIASKREKKLEDMSEEELEKLLK